MARNLRNKRLHNFLVALLVLVLFFIALFWAGALSNIETHVDGVLVCAPEDNQHMLASEMVTSADGAPAPDYSVDLARRMRAAGDVDTRVVAEAVFAPHALRLSRFQALAADHPDNRLAALHLLKVCLKNMDAPGCEPRVVSSVAELDGDNAFAWGLIARYRFLQGDEYGAFASLRQAAEAPVYDDYFARQLVLVDAVIPDTLQPQANLQRMDPLRFALNASLLDYTYLEYCSATVNDQPQIGDACLALFEKMEADSTALLYRNLGRGGRETMHSALGEFEQVAALEQENRTDRAEHIALSQGLEHAHYLRMFDLQLHANWIQNFSMFGEAEALRMLRDEARRKSDNPDYRPCNPPGIRFEWPF